jgi:hypothetical protein
VPMMSQANMKFTQHYKRSHVSVTLCKHILFKSPSTIHFEGWHKAAIIIILR